MKPLTFVLLLIVGFAVMGATEAQWSIKRHRSSGSRRGVLETIGNAYNAAEEWAKDHPLASGLITGGIVALVAGPGAAAAAAYMASRGGKRETEDTSYEAMLDSLDRACPNFQLDDDVTLPEIVRAGFREVDANGDGQLSDAEFQKFTSLTAIIKYCMDLKKMQ